MNYTIRPFIESDLQGVVELWDEAFPSEPTWNSSEQLIRRKLTTQPELFFVCTIEDQVVGTTIAGFDGVRGWVHKVATHPEYRRQGISKALMHTAELALADKGCTKLNLQVRQGNENAARFYQSIGFDIEQRISLSKHIGVAS